MKLPEKYRYVVIEGPIGVGKTTLARAISEATGASLMLEDPAANPFLPRFYENAERYALPTQLFFLFQRVDQLAELNQADLFQRATIADFMLEKDALFARLNLKDDELRLYEQIYDHLKLRAPVPDLVVYLQAAPDTLIERVQRRGASYEKNIPEPYLIGLAETYTRFFYQYSGAPLLIVNSDRVNFVESQDALALLMDHIAGMRGPREFVNLGG
jgi:deoxyadenosine/deoxycytidine kinase